jgi:hypothetical protein
MSIRQQRVARQVDHARARWRGRRIHRDDAVALDHDQRRLDVVAVAHVDQAVGLDHQRLGRCGAGQAQKEHEQQVA